jgi:hypothetical protein
VPPKTFVPTEKWSAYIVVNTTTVVSMPVRRPTSIKVPLLPPQTVVQTAPVYGNLKQRCLELVGQLNEFATERADLMNTRYPHVSELEFNGWRSATDKIFRVRYLRQIKNLRDELGTFHFQDEELDEILEADDRNEEARKIPRRSPFYGSGWITTVHIRVLGERLAALASRIPQN